MIHVLQYGEGNFLRAFADAYFDTLCEEGYPYRVTVVTPIPHGNTDAFDNQNNRYHVVLRGTENGNAVEKVRCVRVLDRVFSPFADYASYEAIASDPELKLIVSNTTEAGICFCKDDTIDGFSNITFPAKLTKLLYSRFLAEQDGVYLLPVELIDNNADELKRCVEQYIDLWQLPDEFRRWNDTQNFYCNTLVDRIVSGYPRDDETHAHLTDLIGENDALMTVGEPFGLWAVEKKGAIEQYIHEGVHNIEVVLTDDIAYYKKRKVRVLNGSHTNLTPTALWEGAHTVYDCMNDHRLRSFLLETLEEEIVPFVSDDVTQTTIFADSVLDRFANPYLNHQLTSIALNSVSKWRARVLPSFKDYYAFHGRIPQHLVKGFAYLTQLYRLAREQDGQYVVPLPTRTITLADDTTYLTHFTNGGTVAEWLASTSIWGEDLTAYTAFLDTVTDHLCRLDKGESLL